MKSKKKHQQVENYKKIKEKMSKKKKTKNKQTKIKEKYG